MTLYNISFSKGIIMISNHGGGETYITSKYRWIRYLKSKNIVFFTDLNNNLQFIHLNSDRLTMSCFHLNVDRVYFMNNNSNNHFVVYDKNEKSSFYSVVNVLEQIEKSFTPRILPIFVGNIIYVSEKYVASDILIDKNFIEIRIFDIQINDFFVSLQMNGSKMMGCQFIEKDDVFFVYTDIECIYVSESNREILLRTKIETIGNYIFVQKKIETGFEIYVFDVRKNEIIYDFQIAGNWIQYNHVLTFDDSTVLRAWTECQDRAFVVI